jgi:hypothetical protein
VQNLALPLLTDSAIKIRHENFMKKPRAWFFFIKYVFAPFSETVLYLYCSIARLQKSE